MSTKVFVGNLVFTTTGDQLKTAFSPSANVVSANIITRGRRSLGYGFVEFATEEDAVKAVSEMNKKEIDGRPINVELARPRDPTKEAEVREKRATKVAKPRQPRQPKAEGATNEDGTAAASSSSPSANGNGRRRGRGKGPSAAGANATEGATSSVTGSSPNGGSKGPRRNGSTGGARRTGGTRRPRSENPSTVQPTAERPASDTTLFVANVPFSTDDDQLKSFFESYKPKSAHVVRMRNGRSRGYGFVEFESAADQKAGLAVDGKDVPLPNGTTLKLSVKIAMTPPPIQASSDSAAPSEAAAPASETPK